MEQLILTEVSLGTGNDNTNHISVYGQLYPSTIRHAVKGEGAAMRYV